MAFASNNNVVGVVQREYGITNAYSKTPIIGTESVGPCVVMTVRNPAIVKEAALAHFDNRTATLENVDRVFKEMMERLPPNVALEVSFIGGWKGGGRAIQKLVDQIPDLQKKYPCKIDTSKLFSLQHGQGYAYVGIDARTGNVTASDDPGKFINYKEMEERSKPLTDLATMFQQGSVDLALTVDTRGAIVIPKAG